MSKIIFQTLAVSIVLLYIPSTLKAQLFVANELYPNISVIKGKYFNGSGVGGYTSLHYVDSIGRVVKKDMYHKCQMITSSKIKYDENNNELFEFYTSSSGNTVRTDTSQYKYGYSADRIVYQIRKFSTSDSSVIELIKNVGDSVLTYREVSLGYRGKKDSVLIYQNGSFNTKHPTHPPKHRVELEKIYTLKYKNNQMISKDIYDKETDSKEITTYEYFDNGRLKRRMIASTPKEAIKSNYIGGPGSDDEYYDYKLDSEGRVVKFYRIIDKRKYKIAVYRYE